MTTMANNFCGLESKRAHGAMRQTEGRIFMASNSSSAVLSLFLLLQLGGALAFVLGGLYILYCFNRAASGVERMADAAEAWLALQHYQAAQTTAAPAATVETAPVTSPKPPPPPASTPPPPPAQNL